MQNIHKQADDLILIDLDLAREGFRRFISAWLYQNENATLLVDPGPRAVYPTLKASLAFLGIKKIDAILLTHIHIDHAGGAGLLFRDFPGAQIICHPKAFRFLDAPGRLWEESQKVLGSLAHDYGEIEPIPASSLSFAEQFAINQVEISALDTPGHAPHHLCFLTGDLLFAGEMAGVTYPLPDDFYLRPATPMGFREEIFKGSLGKLTNLPARRICFGHYGYRTDPTLVIEKSLAQLNRWLDVLQSKIELAETALDEEEIFKELLNIDPLLTGFAKLPLDIQIRERYFIHNSIRGLHAYLKQKRSESVAS